MLTLALPVSLQLCLITSFWHILIACILLLCLTPALRLGRKKLSKLQPKKLSYFLNALVYLISAILLHLIVYKKHCGIRHYKVPRPGPCFSSVSNNITGDDNEIKPNQTKNNKKHRLCLVPKMLGFKIISTINKPHHRASLTGLN